jgi:serine protease Do
MRDTGGGRAVRSWVRRYVLLAAAVLAGAVVPAVPAQAAIANLAPSLPVTEAERAAAIAEPAMVSIEVTWEGYVRHRADGTLYDESSVRASTRCGGVGVSSDGYVLTTGRCLDPTTVAMDFYQEVANRRVAKGLATPDQVPALLADMLTNATIVGQPVTEPPKRTVQVRRAVTLDEPLAASVVSIADPLDGDAALIKIEKTNQPMLELAGADDVKPGTEVVTVECPDDNAPAVRPTSRTGAIATVTPAVLANAAPSTALLGGPVLTNEAAIAGVVSRHQGSQDVLAPLPVIRELLTESEVDGKLGEVDQDFRDGLDAYYDGRYTDSIEKFDAVLAVIPSHIQAHDYRDQAQAKREAEGGGQREGNGVIENVRGWMDGRSGALVGLGVLAAIIVFLIRRKGHHREALAPPSQIRPAAPDYCDNCNTALPDAADTCPSCGKPRSETSSTT